MASLSQKLCNERRRVMASLVDYICCAMASLTDLFFDKSMKNFFKYMILIHKPVKRYDNTMQLCW